MILRRIRWWLRWLLLPPVAGGAGPVSADKVLTDAWDPKGHGLKISGAPAGKASKGPAVNVSITSGPGAQQILPANPNRQVALIANNNPAGGQTLYVGRDSGVTSANGFPIPPGLSIADATSTDAWFGITASATADTRALEFF